MQQEQDGQTIETEIEIDESVFNAAYLPFLNAQQRYQIFFGGSSAGKSHFIARRNILDVMQGGRNFLMCRNVRNTIRHSSFNEIKKAIYDFQLEPYFKINQSDFVITCFNGYQIIFVGLDDPEKIKSITPAKGVITDIDIEEATEIERNAFKQLEKRLRGESEKKKRFCLRFNPILKDHWIYQEFFGKWDDSKNLYQDEDLLILKTTYKDNLNFLEPDDVKALENETDKYFYEVYTLGNWGIIGAVIFKNWRVEDCSEIRKIADKFKNGLDFGFSNDPAALVHTYYDKTRKRIYILEEFGGTGFTNDVLAREVKKVIGNQLVTADSAEPKSIAELKYHGVNIVGAVKGKDSINHGIQWLQQQEIIIDVHCQNTKNNFQKYKRREDRNGNVLTDPVDRDNDYIDATRYAYEDEMANRRIVLPRAIGKRQDWSLLSGK